MCRALCSSMSSRTQSIRPHRTGEGGSLLDDGTPLYCLPNGYPRDKLEWSPRIRRQTSSCTRTATRRLLGLVMEWMLLAISGVL
jgi:hypothetical protein